jgi:hypothetical protein
MCMHPRTRVKHRVSPQRDESADSVLSRGGGRGANVSQVYHYRAIGMEPNLVTECCGAFIEFFAG